jgi:hypothetical protein
MKDDSLCVQTSYAAERQSYSMNGLELDARGNDVVLGRKTWSEYI